MAESREPLTRPNTAREAERKPYSLEHRIQALGPHRCYCSKPGHAWAPGGFLCDPVLIVHGSLGQLGSRFKSSFEDSVHRPFPVFSTALISPFPKFYPEFLGGWGFEVAIRLKVSTLFYLVYML